MYIYWDLFVTFFKVGLFTFGGGYSMLPIVQKEVVETKGWVSMSDVMDYYGISQCTPGVIAVNTSIFIGNRVKKFWGGFVCGLGVIMPSLIIILLIAALLSNFMELAIIQLVFKGVRVAVSALIVNATYTMFKAGVLDIYTFIIFVISFVVLFFFKVSPIVLVIAFALVGIVISLLKNKEKR
ncbi:MAG: chromate transporter [Erysipelotrichaceae bacterium]